MKIDLLTATIAAVILSLPLPTLGKSASNPQSMLDPLAIQEEPPKKPVQQKHSHNSQRRASAQKETKRSQLSETLNSEPEFLNTYQTVADLHIKSPHAHANKNSRKEGAQSQLSWNSKLTQRNSNPGSRHNKRAPKIDTTKGSSGNNKNIFHSGADTAGKVFTAPVRGLQALFKSKQPKPPKAGNN